MDLRPEVREKWVSALRSGEYPQTTGRLHDEDGYCCLGVLCEVAIKEGVSIAKGPRYDGRVFYDDKEDLPPHSVAEWATTGGDPDPTWALDVEWASLPGETPEYGVHQSDWVELTELNDSAHLTFEQIAYLIEKDGRS